MSIHRVTLTALYFGQVCQNVMHFKCPDGSLNDAAICAEINANFIDNLRAVSSANVVWNDISSQRRDVTIPPSPAHLAISKTGSQSGSTDNMTFLCYLLRIGTGLSGRHHRGRIYVPGPNSSLTSFGLWNSGVVALWATQTGPLVTKYGAGGTRPIELGVAPRNDPTSFVVMTTLVLAPIPGLQRRRNIGIGI